MDYRIFSSLAKVLLDSGARRATKYLGEREVIKATRKIFRAMSGKPVLTEVQFTYGRPNYEERKFIRLVKKAGEAFPVKKIQLRFPKSV